jgi:cell division transport system permease protein
VTRLRRAGRLVRRVRRAWERAAAGVWRRKLAFTLTAGVIAVSLALVGVVRLGATWAENAASSWDGGVHMVVYMQPGTGPLEAREVAATLEALAAVERATYVSPQEAMARLEQVFGDHSDALLGVEAALLPASVEVKLSGGAPDPASASVIESRLAGVEVIEEVEVVGAWMTRLYAASRGLGTLGMALFALALAASAFVVASALELGLRGRRRERELLEILGASPMAARAPVIIEGVVLGVVGAAGALAITYAAWAVTHESVSELLVSVLEVGADRQKAPFLPLRDALQIAGVGVLAGLLGGAFASRRGSGA